MAGSCCTVVNSNDLSSKTRFDLWVLPMTGDSKPVPFLSTPFREGRGQFSPDGKWVAYTSDESGGNEVYVQSFPAGGAKWPVSSKGGDWVRWRRDGREMFYIAADRKLMSVAVQPISGSLEFGTPRAVVHDSLHAVHVRWPRAIYLRCHARRAALSGAGASRGRCIAIDDRHSQLASGVVHCQEVIGSAPLVVRGRQSRART